MLFTSALFVVIYLPLTLAGFFLTARHSQLLAAAWLFLASLFFYGWWMPVFTWLLLASICANFLTGLRIARSLALALPTRARWWLIAGVALNLSLLAYFKYANFFVDNLNLALGAEWAPGRVILPIGISFYSFTQIAFLVDTYRQKASEPRFVQYGLFVTYFPHLIAGPVLHHAQMMPQFADPAIYRFNAANFSAGLAIFAMGLVKKVVLADGVAPYADAVFGSADAGVAPDQLESWLGAIAYTVQLYFDFSGYSDMAIGLSWMFNVRLPFNFNSPYRAISISDFWRRWHISLSNFLRDYLYIALGGNQRGRWRRYRNLAITMVLGGLWHGASWSFVLWGTLHGLYLMINHGFRAMCGRELCGRMDRSRTVAVLGWALTMLSVIAAWAFFRAETLAGALLILRSMVGRHELGAAHIVMWNAGLQPAAAGLWCLALGALAVLAPNSNHVGTRLRSEVELGAFRRAFVGAGAACVIVFMVVINMTRDSVSAFIYFNF